MGMSKQAALDAAVQWVRLDLDVMADNYGDVAEGLYNDGVEEDDFDAVYEMIVKIKHRLIKYTEENMGDLSD